MLIAGLLWLSFPGLSSTTHKSQSQRVKIVVPPSDRKASTQLPSESTKAAKEVTKPAAVRKSEPKQTQKRGSSAAEQSVRKKELPVVQSGVAKKPIQAVSLQRSEAQIWESLPRIARVRSGPSIHAPVLQLIRRGTRLRVAGIERDWLVLQLRNGGTGWIHQSLARPQRGPVEKPLSVLKQTKGTSESFSAQSDVIKESSSEVEVFSSMQNGSEVALIYPD